MEQFILWFSIMSFTLMFGAFGATYVVYGRYKPPWLLSYLLYLASYALFLLLITYRFFSLVYLPHPIPTMDSIVAYLRLAVDLFLLLIVPRFILNLIPQKETKNQIILIFVMAALVFSVTIMALIWDHQLTGWISKIFFNSYLGLITFYGLFQIRSSKTMVSLGVMVPFLYFSSAFYVVLVVLTFVRFFIPPSTMIIRSNIIVGGLICFLWGAITLGYLVQKIFRQDAPAKKSLPVEFMEQFSITLRERETITLLLQGKSNREIGEKLFISPRTVEAHIYNIYRKCSVKNKMELANLISNNP